MKYFIQINLWNEFDNLSYRDYKDLVEILQGKLDGTPELKNFTWTIWVEDDEQISLLDFD